MERTKTLCVVVLLAILTSAGAIIAAGMGDDDFSPEFLAELAEGEEYQIAEVRTSPDLSPPVRLEADGEPIDIGKLANVAHAGPSIADVDGDGDRDLLVGDFPGFFWLFDNIGSELAPVYTSKGKLQAGGEDARTPVY